MGIPCSTRRNSPVGKHHPRAARNLGTFGHPGKRGTILALAAVAVFAVLGFSQGALAANPTYAIVSPSEWNLPITPSTFFFFQTGIVQVNNEAYDLNGDKYDLATNHLVAGISRFGQLFSFKSMPNTGFFWEVLVPEISVYGHGNSVSGIGDPLLDLSVYWKPSPQSTVGFQNIVATTFGNTDLSAHFWEYMPSLFGDVNFGKWELDGTIGAGFPSDRNYGGTTTDIGNMYFFQGSLLFHATDKFAPFINFNYQKNKASRDKYTGELEPGAAPVFTCVEPGACHESDVGGGIKWTWSATQWFTIWYMAGVSGENTVRTNAVVFRFVNIF